MNALRANGQQPEPASRHFEVFEVDEYGTLRPAGAKDPETYADIYPDIDTSRLLTPEDFVRAGEYAAPLALRFGTLLADALAHQQQVVAELPDQGGRKTKPHMQLQVLQVLEKRGWQAWVRMRGGAGVARLRSAVASWLRDEIDWTDTESLPYNCGPQGEALQRFESLPAEAIEALGVKLVYGDHPGSTYYAAELATDLDAANAAAEQQGLQIRFVCQGEGPGLGAAPVATAACPLPTPLPSPFDRLSAELEARFVPTFGLMPDVMWRVLIDPAQVRTLVPPDLQARHDSVLFQACWDRITAAIREPVRQWVDDTGTRHVQVLGIGIYSFALNGQVSCRIWKIDAIGKAHLLHSPEDTMSIDGVPWRWLWFEVWQRAFSHEVHHAGGQLGSQEPGAEDRAYAKWAFGIFKHRVRGGCDLRVMRSRIAQALALDSQALMVARLIKRVDWRGAVRASQYNQALQRRGAYRKLAHDAPRLVMAYALLSRHAQFPAGGEPLQQIRQFMAGQQLSERCWRMLLKSGPGLWKPMADFYDHNGAESALGYLRFLDKMQWHKPADPELVCTVLSLRGGPGGARHDYADRFGKVMPTLLRIVNWFERGDEQQRAEIRARLHQVLSWLDYAGGAELSKLSRQPGWASLVKRSETWWQRRRALQTKSEVEWSVPCKRVVIDDYEIVFISKAEELYDEARAMRHCAFDYLHGCARGEYAFASMRHLPTARRMATLKYRQNGKEWILDQIAGQANRVATDKQKECAQAAATRISIGP